MWQVVGLETDDDESTNGRTLSFNDEAKSIVETTSSFWTTTKNLLATLLVMNHISPKKSTMDISVGPRVQSSFYFDNFKAHVL